MRLRELKPDDLEYLKEHSISRGIQKHHPGHVDFYYTLEDEEAGILAIGGICLINLTTAWCWLDMTDLMVGRIVSGYRIIRDWLDIFVESNNIRRLQAYVECDFKEAISLVEHLGFERESTMKSFTDDKDAYMYRRLA